MNIENDLRVLRTNSVVVLAFAVMLSIAAVVQLGLGGMAVKDEYERIEQVEELARPTTYYGYQAQRAALQAEYNRSSSAFFLEGRFLSSTGSLEPGTPSLLAAGVVLLALLGLIASALAWVWRAQRNLRRVGLMTKYGPEMSAAAFLIPIANLVLPHEIMRELHNRSHGEADELAHSAVEDVTAWSTAMLVGLLIFSAMIVKFVLDAGTNLIIMTPLWMEFAIVAFAIVLLAGSALLFAGLTRKISAAQSEYLPTIEVTETTTEDLRPYSVTLVGE